MVDVPPPAGTGTVCRCVCMHRHERKSLSLLCAAAGRHRSPVPDGGETSLQVPAQREAGKQGEKEKGTMLCGVQQASTQVVNVAGIYNKRKEWWQVRQVIVGRQAYVRHVSQAGWEGSAMVLISCMQCMQVCVCRQAKA